MQSDKQSNSFLKYSGLALQMIGTLLLFTWLGRKGDSYYNFKTPWLTIIAMLLGLVGIMYKLIKDFSKK
jgi:F0F1-type ATP synthase assembly protein I